MIKTDGTDDGFYDMCPFCTLDTGGAHEIHCPYNSNSRIFRLVERGLEDIRQGRFELYREVKDGTD